MSQYKTKGIMNKLLIVIFTSLITQSGMVLADNDSATVHITGNIKAGTCKPQDKDVDFKDVERSSFSGAGTVGATQDFTLELTDCSSDITKINMSATGTADDQYPESFATISEDGTTDNLAVKISHGDNDIKPDGSTEITLQPVDGNVSETFTASLMQDSGDLPKLGKFSSTVTVSFEYM
ncbi:type 1 fimbrial protein [Enterobacter oligotrophicus]|nr:type 1 fimbrial protein [Enterobacter oligotrophicus]